MKKETITITNRSGTEIKLSYDPVNLIEDLKGIGLRIPMQIKTITRPVVIEAYKTNYTTAESFLNRVEQFGKPFVSKWLEASSDDSIVMPPPDMAHLWTIGLGPLDEQTPK